jgi:hypothetical protein
MVAVTFVVARSAGRTRDYRARAAALNFCLPPKDPTDLLRRKSRQVCAIALNRCGDIRCAEG